MQHVNYMLTLTFSSVKRGHLYELESKEVAFV